MSDSPDQPGETVEDRVVPPAPAAKVEVGEDSPAATFARVRRLRQDGYRPRRSEAGPPRHLRLLD